MNKNNETRIENLARQLTSFGFEVAEGLTKPRIDDISSAFGWEIPADLRRLLAICVPVTAPSKQGPFVDWRRNPKDIASETLARMTRTLEFDIRNCGYWCSEFGEKPVDTDKSVERARAVVSSWPPLIPVFGHRMMPSEVVGARTPVLSVSQFIDTIVYGNDLYDYFIREFRLPISVESEGSITPVSIPKWGVAFETEGQIAPGIAG